MNWPAWIYEIIALFTLAVLVGLGLSYVVKLNERQVDELARERRRKCRKRDLEAAFRGCVEDD